MPPKNSQQKNSQPRNSARSGNKPTSRNSKRSSAPNANSTSNQVKVFGIHAVSSLINLRPQDLHQLYVQTGKQAAAIQQLISQAQQLGVPVEQLEKDNFNKLATGVHQGILALAKPKPAGNEKELEDLLINAPADQPPLLLVLDSVTDPHNLGACIRSAEAAGALALITTKDKSASLNATVRKVACGAAESLNLIQVTNLARTLRLLQDFGVKVIGTAGEAEELIYNLDLTGPTALVMGAEGTGLRRLTRENCNQLAKLPMAGEVSSLNVSVASGVVLFEAARQRLNN